MVLEALPNTPSSAQMEPSSTKNTSSVIGGSTSIAQKLKDFTPWMKTLLLNVKPYLLPKEALHLLHPHKDLMLPQAEVPPAVVNPPMKADKAVTKGQEGSKEETNITVPSIQS